MLYRDYRPEDRQAIGAVHDAARKTELRLPGRKDGAEAKSFIHRKRGVHPVWMHAPAFLLCYRLRSSTYSSLGLLSSSCAAAGAAFWAGSSSSRMPSRQSKYFMAISGNRA